MIRKLIGAIMFTLGVAGLVIDYHGIHASSGGTLHVINASVELALMIAGVIALVPALALEIAKDLPLFGKAITSVLPGGRRETDPPPQPPA